MKLIRYTENGHIKTGVAIDNNYYDTSSFGEDYNESFFNTYGINRLQDYIKSLGSNLPPAGKDIQLASPVARPSKIICIGLNYADHAKETALTVERQPHTTWKHILAQATI